MNYNHEDLFQNIHHHHFILALHHCRKESTSYLQRAYEEAVKLHQEGNLNEQSFIIS